MTDELLNHLSGLYIEHDIAERYGYTFAQFIAAYENGGVKL